MTISRETHDRLWGKKSAPVTTLATAEMNAATWLADGNAAAEAGNKKKAERCFAKSQYWHDRATKLRGDH